MIKPLQIILGFVFIFIFQNSFAQSLNGTWTGNYSSSGGVVIPSLIQLEFQQVNEKEFTGVLHLYYSRGGYEHTKISAVLNPLDSTIVLREDSAISYKLGFMGFQCLGICNMKLYKYESSYIMRGIWRDKKRGLLKCPDGRIEYRLAFNTEAVIKESPVTFQEQKQEVKKEEPKVPERVLDVQKVIDLKAEEADSIKVEIYDSGTVDDDSISVFFNDKLLIDAQRISVKPIVFYINIDRNIPFNKLVMKAINLGSIPPNTAYMVITTKKRRYTLTLNSNLEKNGTVEFTVE